MQTHGALEWVIERTNFWVSIRFTHQVINQYISEAGIASLSHHLYGVIHCLTVVTFYTAPKQLL